MRSRVKTVTQWTAMIVCALALTACSHLRKTNAAAGGEEAAYTTGLGDQEGLSGSGTSSDGYEDATTNAPANQRYHFAYDSYEVKREDYPSIKAQADYVTSHASSKIFLMGNTDARGSREYNIGLGWRRARAVNDILQMYGVTGKQVEMISYGKEKPLAMGDDEDSYAQNRRVDMQYTSQ